MEKLTKEQVLDKLFDLRIEAFCEVQIESDLSKMRWQSGRVSALDVAIRLVEQMED